MSADPGKPEIWGGVECTVNRVRDVYFDQTLRNGHDSRPEDIAMFAALGIKAIRFPMLWEKFAPDDPEAIDWPTADQRMALVRESGMRPIVGFLHHGSGPRYTSLTDAELPAKLAAYAARFAARYPWVDAYTPINEPLTTARFSGLYGVWYPHARDDVSFFTMVLRQCQAIGAAMAAVRAVNPQARLIQTEDMGRVSSTPLLRYQAEYENTRRWLSFDILTGKFGPRHPLWPYFAARGVPESSLREAQAARCPPDVIGINHYLTSNRFLDERLELFPARLHGGNGRHRYVDVETVRVEAEHAPGPGYVLREVWDRYGLPMAVSEVHLGCSRDEQLRWFAEVWRTAVDLRAEGVDVRAVTAWSLLGSYDWNSLVTKATGHYESGVYDVRSGKPRPTALVGMLSTLARGEDYDHPVLDLPGWWHRPQRLLYPPAGSPHRPMAIGTTWNGGPPRAPRKLLITGSPGTLATAFAYVCEARGLPYQLLGRRDLDISDPDAVRAALREEGPWAIVNAAGYCRVDAAESDRVACERDNVRGPATLAAACVEAGLPLVTFSSDLVFDGRVAEPYLEDAPVAPLNVYGDSKARAEREVLAAHPGALVVRTSAFFGPWDEYNFLTITLRRLARGLAVAAAMDQTVSPTYVPDLANVCLDLLIDGEKGLWHLSNHGAVTWHEFAGMAAERFGRDRGLIEAKSTEDMRLTAPRPRFSVLGSRHGNVMPSLEQALARFARECRVALG